MAGTETITLRLVAQDLLSGNVSKAIGKIDTLAKRGGIMGSVFQGVGQSLGQMLNPLGLATQGFGLMTDLVMDATKAAIEDEKAQARLVTTLKANVDGWQAHTGAIEDAITAAEDLAFTDDDVRASMGRLLPFTKDVTKALQLNALAMDLARARGMSLEDAATMVARAYSGQFTALRRAGIALDGVKTGTQALAALQKQVNGQARAYADTTEGTFQSLQVQIDEIVESIGYELLPTVKDFAMYAKTDLVPAVKDAVKNLKEAVDVLSLLGAVASMDPQVIGKVIDWLQRTDEAAQDLSRTLSVPLDLPGYVGKVDGAFAPVIGEMERVNRIVTQMPEAFRIAVVGMKERIKEGKAGIIEQFRDLAWQSKHPFAEKNYAKWLAEKNDDATRKMKAAARKGKWAVVAQYRDLKDQIMIEMLTLPGALTRLQTQINGILSDIYGRVTNAVGNVFNLGSGGTGGVEPRASGGPVRPGGTYVVGENGPELLTMGAGSGHITPNRQLGGGPTVVVQVTHIGSMSEAEGDRLAAAIEKPLRRRMARAGVG